MNILQEIERDIKLFLGLAALFMCGIGVGILATIGYLIVRT